MEARNRELQDWLLAIWFCISVNLGWGNVMCGRLKCIDLARRWTGNLYCFRLACVNQMTLAKVFPKYLMFMKSYV